MKKMSFMIGLFIFALVIFGSCERTGQGQTGAGQAQENFMNSINGKYVFSVHVEDGENAVIGIAQNNIIKGYFFDVSSNEYIFAGDDQNIEVPRGTKQIIGYYGGNVGFYNGSQIIFENIFGTYPNIPDLRFTASNKKIISIPGSIVRVVDNLIMSHIVLIYNNLNFGNRWQNMATENLTNTHHHQNIQEDLFQDIYSYFGGGYIMILDKDNNLYFTPNITFSLLNIYNDFPDSNKLKIPDNFVNIICINENIIGIVFENHIEFHEYNQSRREWVKSSIKDLQY